MAREDGRAGVCSFTGHRRVPPEHRRALTELLGRAVAYAYGEGCRTFCCGGARGFDTLAAQTVIRFRLSHPEVRLCLYLPCRTQDAQWTDKEREAYSFILSGADEICYVSDAYTPTCMRERNRILAECCDLLIAYVSRAYSGAAQTVRLAQRSGKRVYNLAPTLLAGTPPAGG